MSNRKKLRGSRPPLPRCACCGKSVPKAMYRKVMPNGLGVVCERCVSAGATFRQLGCGHYGVVGTKVLAASDPRLSVCGSCSQEGTLSQRVLGWVGAVPRSADGIDAR